MGRVVIQWAWRRKGAFVLCAALCLSLPGHTFAWGKNGHRLVVNKAIDTLPQDIRPFFESNLPLLSQHVTDPLDAIAKLEEARVFSTNMGDSRSKLCLATIKPR